MNKNNLNPSKSDCKICFTSIFTLLFIFTFYWNAKAAKTLALQDYPTSSVLSSGNWYKYKVEKSGLYKFSFEDLKNAGIISGLVSSRDLRVFGNGTGMLPIDNSGFHPKGLLQVPLMIDDGGDNVFGDGDAIYFYGAAANQLEYDEANSIFLEKEMVYDVANYYFVNAEAKGGPQKLITQKTFSNTACEGNVNTHTGVKHYEQNLKNLIKSGREKYGETFDFTLERIFNFNLNNKADDKIRYYVSVAASSSGSPSSFNISLNGTSALSLTINSTGLYNPYNDRRQAANANVSGENLDVKLNFNKPNSSASGVLDEIVINYNVNNSTTDNSVWVFPETLDPATNYCVNVPNALVYDVSDHNNVEQLMPNAGKVQMLLNTNTRLLVATKTNALKPILLNKIENQNLHAIANIDYLIVVPDIFREQAERLAELHRNDGLKVEVVKPQLIYNEFSSGAVDAGGIRNFVKHLYFSQASASNPLRYLLLFGDASYNNNFDENDLYLPSYQSLNSTNLISSYATDDFYGFLDENEGTAGNNLLDIGIGRFPVSTLTEATTVVDKIIRYKVADQPESFGTWRNKVVFVSDDQNGEKKDGVIHMRDANRLAEQTESSFNGYQEQKIYLDAYKQVSTPGGERYPEANKAIDKAVNDGALLVNYTGHGGELGWAHERILDVPTINAWKNIDKLTLFVTATCEFSRFDDPDRISAGEYTLINPNGGSIALFTTTRLVFAVENYELSRRFYKYVFPSEQYPDLRLGDIIRLTKVDISGDRSLNTINHLNFSLLGDPALRLNYPKDRVYTTKINGIDISNGQTDTIKALEKVRVEGYIGKNNGDLLSNFNGQVEVLVNDKKSELNTLDNDDFDSVFSYNDWDKVIYKGLAEVKNGKFSFEFIVPRDLVFTYGSGRFAYYARSENSDANGNFSDFTIGGQADSLLADDEGPIIDLFLNNTFFKPGDKVGTEGLMLAFLSDSSGINTTGNGVGHDIIAYIDGDTKNAQVVNSFFTADLNSYQSGLVKFPLSDLSIGEHTLTVRAWDINNNASENSTRFIVSDGSELQLTELFNYPNPVTNTTRFAFKSNAGDEIINATVKIYDTFGKLIDVVSRDFTNGSFENEGLEWNINSNGRNISSGTFVYALELKNQAGESAVMSSTLVVFR